MELKGIEVKQHQWKEPYEFWELALQLEVSYVVHFESLIEMAKQNND